MCIRDREELVPPLNSYFIMYIDPPSDDDPEAQVLYIMLPCMDRSGMPPCTDWSFRHESSPRYAFTADPFLIFSTHVNYDYVNVNDPSSVPHSIWPSSGITLWFSGSLMMLILATQKNSTGLRPWYEFSPAQLSRAFLSQS